MSARTLMVQGTSSDAGKSTLVAGLCRILHRRGARVAPFKPQNMSLNSAVSADGGEIGRAQALQAQAAGTAPLTDMNPVLLKPTTRRSAQVIVHGRAVAELEASDYRAYQSQARAAVLASYARLAARFEWVIVEGAGSPAEINLREGDIANMGFAEAIDCPVVLVADIERGGVFAQLVGTLALLADSERRRTAGFIINRFRGEEALLRPGLEWLERHTGKSVLGVVPFLEQLRLDAEDSLARPHAVQKPTECETSVLRIVVPALPRLSNHTDFEPLQQHPQVQLRYVTQASGASAADLVILPGSKAVRADLAWLRAQGWPPYLERHLRYGGKLLGICGGFQMLGEAISDPQGLEGDAGESAGLGYFALQTVLQPRKALLNVRGELLLEGAPVRGYEIHAGRSTGPALQRAAMRLEEGRTDGALSEDGKILGTYVHGLFDTPAACAALLRWAGLAQVLWRDHTAERERMLEALADVLERTLALETLLALARPCGDLPDRRPA